jgi:hypothetical protein
VADAPSGPPATILSSGGTTSTVSVTGAVPVSLGCSGSSACEGTVVLTGGTLSSRAASAKGPVLGRASYSIAAGESEQVKITLTAAGRKLLKMNGKLKATLTVRSADGATEIQTITLKAKKR